MSSSEATTSQTPNNRNWLRNLHQQFSVTTTLVTHDQQEAMQVAEEIVIFNKGRIEQIGKPRGILKRT